ncbi:hypothetical protein Cni_G15863 [Canna indica]|uniref:Reverse transcriptase domain-containing protein n=1 Tax=Canna indica TaxID=4628 RepID=A0AAQ3QF61_9LILI|nr:hypothetical protein Cni_G15863 [Canna indica]
MSDAISQLKWKRLNNQKRAILCNEFTHKEIWEAVNSLGRGKAPGPDGYNVEFFIKYWAIVKDSFISGLTEFANSAVLPASWGETDLIFIPKKDGASKVTDHRLIALCNVTYKIVSKVLVNKLKAHISFLISEEQSAFVSGRKMHDSILMVSELVDVISKSKRKWPYIILKLDLEKVFDRVS